MAHVFISYKSADHKFAFELKSQLEKAGYEVWIDKERLRAGEDWREEIETAIRQSFVLILILTPEAALSKYVIYEFAYAWALNIKVIPVMFKNIDLKDFHPRLEGRQYESALGGKLDLAKLIDRLQEVIQQHTDSIIQIPKGSPVAVTNLIPLLDNSERNNRLEAIRNLTQIRHPSVIEVLLAAAIQHLYRDVKINAAFGLTHVTNLTDDQALRIIPTLLEAITYEDQDVIQQAKNLLIKMGALAVPVLIEFWDDDVPWHVNDAIKDVLLKIGDSALPNLMTVFDTRSEDIRFQTVWLLKDMKDDAVVPGLIKALNDKSARVRVAAARVLRDYGADAISATPVLKALLTDEEIPDGQDHPVSFQAAITLYRMGTPETIDAVVPYLIQELSNTRVIEPFSGNRACDIAFEALSTINTPEARNAVEEYQRSQRKNGEN